MDQKVLSLLLFASPQVTNKALSLFNAEFVTPPKYSVGLCNALQLDMGSCRTCNISEQITSSQLFPRNQDISQYLKKGSLRARYQFSVRTDCKIDSSTEVQLVEVIPHSSRNKYDPQLCPTTFVL